MACPRVDNCGCCGLRTGTKIIAWIEIPSFVALVVVCAWELYQLDYTTRWTEDLALSVLFFSYCGLAAFCGLHALVSATLLWAARRSDSAKALWPWLVFSASAMLVALGALLVNSVAYVAHHDYEEMAVTALVTCVAWVLKAFFTVIVFSFYKELQESNTSDYAPIPEF